MHYIYVSLGKNFAFVSIKLDSVIFNLFQQSIKMVISVHLNFTARLLVMIPNFMSAPVFIQAINENTKEYRAKT